MPRGYFQIVIRAIQVHSAITAGSRRPRRPVHKRRIIQFRGRIRRRGSRSLIQEPQAGRVVFGGHDDAAVAVAAGPAHVHLGPADVVEGQVRGVGGRLEPGDGLGAAGCGRAGLVGAGDGQAAGRDRRQAEGLAAIRALRDVRGHEEPVVAHGKVLRQAGEVLGARCAGAVESADRRVAPESAVGGIPQLQVRQVAGAIVARGGDGQCAQRGRRRADRQLEAVKHVRGGARQHRPRPDLRPVVRQRHGAVGDRQHAGRRGVGTGAPPCPFRPHPEVVRHPARQPGHRLARARHRPVRIAGDVGGHVGHVIGPDHVVDGRPGGSVVADDQRRHVLDVDAAERGRTGGRVVAERTSDLGAVDVHRQLSPAAGELLLDVEAQAGKAGWDVRSFDIRSRRIPQANARVAVDGLIGARIVGGPNHVGVIGPDPG